MKNNTTQKKKKKQGEDFQIHNITCHFSLILSLNIHVFTNQLDQLQHFKFGTKVIQEPLKDNIDCEISDSVILSENFAYVYQ